MVPLLILQIFLFPLTAIIIMDNWADSRRTLELQETAAHLGSTIQQLYYTVQHVGGTMKISLDIPQTIEGLAYTVTLRNVTRLDGSSQVRIMNITLNCIGADGFASTLVTLGGNTQWQTNTAFNSTQRNLSLTAAQTGGIITLTVGGT